MIKRTLKPVLWTASSRADLCRLSPTAQDRLGLELHRVQLGLMPHDFKPMRSISAGVYEIRSHVDGEYRLIYIARFEEAIYVLHAFQKKSQKTRARDIEVAKSRLAALYAQRKSSG